MAKFQSVLTLVVAVNVVIFILGCHSWVSKSPETKTGFYPMALSQDDPYFAVQGKSWWETPAWAEYEKTYIYKQAKPYQQIRNDADYCQRRESLKRQIKFGDNGLPIKQHRVAFTDYTAGLLSEKAVGKWGTTVLIDHTFDSKSKDVAVESLPLDLDIVYTNQYGWHKRHYIGVNWLCPANENDRGQRYNHIPGSTHLAFKEAIPAASRQYAKRYQEIPECYDPWEFIPETYSLEVEEECQYIMNKLVEQYEAKDPYLYWIGKTGHDQHNGEGVELMGLEEIGILIERYNSGESCGEIQNDNPFILQKYIDNPFLLGGKKFDFRSYFCIVSMDPVILLFHPGLLRVSMNSYNTDDPLDRSMHLTNLAISKEEEEGKTKEEKAALGEDTVWMWDRFEKYLAQVGLDSKWAVNHIKTSMKRSMYHIFKMNQHYLLPHPQVWENFGLDYMLDDDLNIWYLETAPSPGMQANTPEKGDMQRKLVEDILNIQLAIMYGQDIDAIIEQSDFEWIFDDRKEGYEKYHGVIPEECVV